MTDLSGTFSTSTFNNGLAWGFSTSGTTNIYTFVPADKTLWARPFSATVTGVPTVYKRPFRRPNLSINDLYIKAPGTPESYAESKVSERKLVCGATVPTTNVFIHQSIHSGSVNSGGTYEDSTNPGNDNVLATSWTSTVFRIRAVIQADWGPRYCFKIDSTARAVAAALCHRAPTRIGEYPYNSLMSDPDAAAPYLLWHWNNPTYYVKAFGERTDPIFQSVGKVFVDKSWIMWRGKLFGSGYTRPYATQQAQYDLTQGAVNGKLCFVSAPNIAKQKPATHGNVALMLNWINEIGEGLGSITLATITPTHLGSGSGWNYYYVNQTVTVSGATPPAGATACTVTLSGATTKVGSFESPYFGTTYFEKISISPPRDVHYDLQDEQLIPGEPLQIYP
jgi:hypothetical protein